MTTRRRHPQDGARGAAALLLAGTLLLGAGAGIALGDDPRVVAEDLGTLPAAATGPARPVPAAAALPVLSAPAPAPVASGVLDGAGAPGPGPAQPGPAASAPGAPDPGGPQAVPGAGQPDPAGPEERARPLPGPGATPPRPAGPPPIAPAEPWTVSPIHALPAEPAPGGPGTDAGPDPGAPPQPVVPATLELPARGITAPVESVATGPDGGMVIPEEVDTVGWWSPGAPPGGAVGSTVIAGHVDSRTRGLGVLSVLPELGVGEPVTVRGTDGRTATYRVAARREYGKHDLPAEVFRRDGSPQLALITCGGVFDPATGSYESNIVVYAVPEPV
ncbi:Sortase family protein [Pseudonocardia ammonioxydans]|uniref:Sortase family protein n=1 Tax=Pseudonocardia ammonioxydans TaxID=260086 RepID=A0A1I4UY58_PSUAM|nr:class F sortase [Pseudonocardia ammonioxydans]SFM93871.1 Sortase family protein [Pseudonocardia ammonioxydans]